MVVEIDAIQQQHVDNGFVYADSLTDKVRTNNDELVISKVENELDAKLKDLG